MTKDVETTMRGTKAAAMLDLWASARRAARDRAPEREPAGEREVEPTDGSPAAGTPAHAPAD